MFDVSDDYVEDFPIWMTDTERAYLNDVLKLALQKDDEVRIEWFSLNDAKARKKGMMQFRAWVYSRPGALVLVPSKDTKRTDPLQTRFKDAIEYLRKDRKRARKLYAEAGVKWNAHAPNAKYCYAHCTDATARRAVQINVDEEAYDEARKQAEKEKRDAKVGPLQKSILQYSEKLSDDAKEVANLAEVLREQRAAHPEKTAEINKQLAELDASASPAPLIIPEEQTSQNTTALAPPTSVAP